MIKYLFISLGLLWFTLGFSQIRITEPRHEFGDVFEEKGIVYAEFKLVNPYPKDTIFIKSLGLILRAMPAPSAIVYVLTIVRVHRTGSVRPQLLLWQVIALAVVEIQVAAEEIFVMPILTIIGVDNGRLKFESRY